MPVTGTLTPVTVNNSTTLVPTGIASGTLAANTVYRFEAVLTYVSSPSFDIKFSFVKESGLSDATAEIIPLDSGSSEIPAGFATELVEGSNTGDRLVGYSGLIFVGSDPGSFRIDFAQNSAGVADTDLNAGILEIYAEEETTPIGKSADETRNSTTTLADDGALVTSTLDADSVYRVELFLPLVAGTTPDIKYTLDRSGLSDGHLHFAPFDSLNARAEDFGDVLTVTATGAAQMGAGTGILVTGTDLGSLKLQWAQNTSDAGDTTVKAGAVLRVVKAA